MKELPELGWITDKVIKRETVRILLENPQYLEQPASVSGKYHQGDTIKDHIQRALRWLQEFMKEFNVRGRDRDLLLSAMFLHDIGKVKAVKKGKVEGWKYYEATGYSSNYGRLKAHAEVGSMKLLTDMTGIAMNDRMLITELVRDHMGHWWIKDKGQQCLRPYCIMFQMSDYLSQSSHCHIDVTEVY